MKPVGARFPQLICYHQPSAFSLNFQQKKIKPTESRTESVPGATCASSPVLRPNMPPPRANRRPQGGQVWAQQMKHKKKVAQYRRFSEYQKALKEVAVDAPVIPAQLPEPDAVPAHAEQRHKPRKPKVSAQALARREWEQQQAQVTAAREAEMREREERQRQQEQNRKRKKELSMKLNKRTKRGQPVLGFEMERLLENIQRSR
jgi:hypothetical protein